MLIINFLIECKKILSLDKKDADAINLMGTIFEKKGLYNRAKKYFLRAIELDENLVSAKINIATLYQLEGKIEVAYKMYIDLLKERGQQIKVFDCWRF